MNKSSYQLQSTPQSWDSFSSQMQAAQKIFKGDGIKITDQGERLLGSVIGTDSFREQYIKNKVE